jgi:DNA-binding Xre family transcriptional regulator
VSAESILKRIEERLRVTGKSAQRASLDAGLSRDAIRNIRRRKKGMSIETLAKLAIGLECQPSDLLRPGDARHDGAQFAEMPISMRSDTPVEFDNDAFEKASAAAEFWIAKRGGGVDTLEYSRILWKLYEHALKNEHATLPS